MEAVVTTVVPLTPAGNGCTKVPATLVVTVEVEVTFVVAAATDVPVAATVVVIGEAGIIRGGVAGLRNRQGLRLLTGVTGGHVATVITDAVATVVTTRGTRLTGSAGLTIVTSLTLTGSTRLTGLTGLTLTGSTRLTGLTIVTSLTLTGSAGLTAITRGARLTGLTLTGSTRLSRLTGLAVTCRRGGDLIRHVSKRSRHCHEGCTQQGCGGAGRNQRLLNSGRFPLMRSHM